MTSISSVIIEAPDPTAAQDFYARAFALGPRVDVRAGVAPTGGFRGFAMSLVVSQPGTVDALTRAALGSGATIVKPAARSLWGYGSSVQAPDGTIWMIASSAKQDSGPVTRDVDDVVLQLGVADVAASKRFYTDHGLTVARSFGRTYVQFATPDEHVTLALYKRRALAKTAGVDPDGSGSHRLVIGNDAGNFTDPDGFVWEAVGAQPSRRAGHGALGQA